MNFLGWKSVGRDVAIIEPTEEAVDAHGHRHGSEVVAFTEEHITALRQGKLLAVEVHGEYIVYIMMNEVSVGGYHD